MRCCLLFNDSYVVHLRSESAAVRRWMNMVWMIYDTWEQMWPKFPDICLSVEEKLWKKPHPGK